MRRAIRPAALSLKQPIPPSSTVFAGREPEGHAVPLPRDIETPITRVPELVIEVLSNNRSYDRFTKRALYAEAGVKEYWLVDIDGSRIEVRTGAALSGERFCTDKLSSLLLPDFVLDVSPLIG